MMGSSRSCVNAAAPVWLPRTPIYARVSSNATVLIILHQLVGSMSIPQFIQHQLLKRS